MADEQKGALEEGASGAGAGASSENPASNTDAASNATETPEQKIARLEQEAADAKKKYDDEHALRLSHQSTVEEANRRAAAQAQQPPPGGYADPLDAQAAFMEAEIEAAKGVLANATKEDLDKYPDLRALRMAAINTAVSLRAVNEQRAARDRERLVQAAEPEIQKLPAALRDKARAIYAAGRAATVADAAMLAKGEGVPDDYNDQLDREKKAREDAERDLKARGDSVGPGSPRPVVSFQRPADGQMKRVRRSEAARIAQLPYGHPDKLAYNAAYGRGQVEVVDD